MKEYICNNCGKSFKRYESQVIFEERVCCSKECARQLTIKSGRLRGKNNPRYKHGEYSNGSYCECGNIKDHRAEKCSKCSKRGIPKIGADAYIIDKELIISLVAESRSYQEIAKKTKYSRPIISRIITEQNIDISHFIHAKGREVDLDKIFTWATKKRNSTLTKYILKYNLLFYKCSGCGITNMYNNKKLVLQLHHIDGNNLNNVLSNLTFLCPNCHSQTDNFTGKNIKPK